MTLLAKTNFQSWAKLLEKVFPIMSTFLRNKTISKTTPLRKENPFPQFNVASHKRPGIRLSFEYTTTLLSGEGGEGRTGTAIMFRKMPPKYTIFSQFCPRLLIFSLERFSQFSPLVKEGVMAVRYNINPPEWYRHTAVYYFTKFLLMFLDYLHVVAKIKKEPFVGSTNESRTILLVTRKRRTKFVMRTACNKSVQFTDR